jgi:hypothetical protein
MSDQDVSFVCIVLALAMILLLPPLIKEWLNER